MQKRTSDDMSWAPDIIRPTQATLTLGSGTAAAIQLLQPKVDRQHAELCLREGSIYVRDCGSTAGTWINGERITDRSLSAGDRISFGPVTYECWGNYLRLQSEPHGFTVAAANLRICRGRHEILANVNLTISPDHFVGVLGPSGAGKSTLIKCLSGFFSPAAGTISFDGKPRSELTEGARTSVGYVPQDDLFYNTLTARENLEYGLRLRIGKELKKDEQDAVLSYTLQRVNLESRANLHAGSLSGGEKKRLNVSLELLSRPRLLFLDEPTSNLDPANETSLMMLLKDLAGTGTTVVCATHVMENLRLFDQVVVLADRTVAYAGSPKGLLAHFGVSTYPELYLKLDKHAQGFSKPSDAAGGIARDSQGKLIRRRALPPVPNKQSSNRISTQIQVLFARSLRTVLRDKMLLALLLSQPLLIGLLIDLSQLRPNGLDPIFLFGVITCIWLGLNNTAREVVRERTIYIRERMIGIGMEAYLGAKCLLYGLIGLIQTLILVMMIRYLNGWLFLSLADAEDLWTWSPFFLFGVLWLTYLSSMLFGLTISSVAGSQEEAVAWLPVMILPQMLLTSVVTGLTFRHHNLFGPISSLVHSQASTPRTTAEWVLEVLSLGTYSRPAMTLLRHGQTLETADCLHLLLLFLATGTLLVYLFRRSERAWLQSV